MEAIRAAVDEPSAAAGKAASREEVDAALLPPMAFQVPGVDSAQLEPRFDVRVRRVRARDFFLGLVEDTPYNVVVHPKVSGYISLDQKNVTVPEVMQTVRNVFGYHYRRVGDTFQVYPNTMHTRMFKVNYLSVVRQGDSYLRSAPGRLDDGERTSTSSTSTAEGTETGQTAIAQGSRIYTSQRADFWAELRSTLQLLVGEGEGRKVAVNGQTGMVLVHAMPDELRAVEEYLQESQISAHRQVILEARIIEVQLSDGFQSGINWATLQQSANSTVIGGMSGGGTIFSGSGVAGSANTDVGLFDSNLDPGPATSTAGTIINTSTFGGVFGVAVNSSDFSAFLELLSSQGDVQVLSSPRVSTVNNQKAVIKVGADEYFVTGLSTTYQNINGVLMPNVDVELTPFFSGVALDVTPQVGEDESIVLHVHPAVSSVNEQVKVVNTTTGSLSMPLAANSVRESDTVVRAHNGQLVVIGGLMKNSNEEEEAGVPGLRDVPVLGALFRHTRVSERKSELVILIKPTVIDSAGSQWDAELRRSSFALDGMERQ